MKKLAISLLAVLFSLSVHGADIPTKTYKNTVSAISGYASDTFEVQTADHIAELLTVPASAVQPFKADTGSVAASKRHGTAIWVELPGEDTEKSHKARSPLIPKGEGSWVICKGRFKDYIRPERPARAATPTKAASPAVPAELVYKDKNWQSRLVPPGAHLVVANVYNTVKDTSGTPSTNDMILGSARALRDQLSDGGKNAVHLGICGLNVVEKKDKDKKKGTEAMIPVIGDLQKFVESEGIAQKTLISFSTLGHGGPFSVTDENNVVTAAENVLIYATAKQDGKDYIGNSGLHPNVKSVSIITDVLSPLFNPDVNCVANLDHCYSASSAAVCGTITFNHKSVAAQFKAKLPAVTITGHDGRVGFGYYRSGGKFIYQPPVTVDGGTWVVL